MGFYRITFKPSVAKDLKHMDLSMVPRIMTAIHERDWMPVRTIDKEQQREKAWRSTGNPKNILSLLKKKGAC